MTVDAEQAKDDLRKAALALQKATDAWEQADIDYRRCQEALELAAAARVAAGAAQHAAATRWRWAAEQRKQSLWGR